MVFFGHKDPSWANRWLQISQFGHTSAHFLLSCSIVIHSILCRLAETDHTWNNCLTSVHVNAYEAVFAIDLKLLRMRDCVRLSPRVHLCVEPCVCAWIFQLEESVHVHYIRQSARGVPQRVCAAVCSELSAPAGSAIPIYPSAAEAGGKSAGHHCRRFHIRGTRLPVRGPLRRGDEGGRPQGCSGGGRGRSEREGHATQCHPGIRSVFWVA